MFLLTLFRPSVNTLIIASKTGVLVSVEAVSSASLSEPTSLSNIDVTSLIKSLILVSILSIPLKLLGDSVEIESLLEVVILILKGATLRYSGLKLITCAYNSELLAN